MAGRPTLGGPGPHFGLTLTLAVLLASGALAQAAPACSLEDDLILIQGGSSVRHSVRKLPAQQADESASAALEQEDAAEFGDEEELSGPVDAVLHSEGMQFGMREEAEEEEEEEEEEGEEGEDAEEEEDEEEEHVDAEEEDGNLEDKATLQGNNTAMPQGNNTATLQGNNTATLQRNHTARRVWRRLPAVMARRLHRNRRQRQHRAERKLKHHKAERLRAEQKAQQKKERHRLQVVRLNKAKNFLEELLRQRQLDARHAEAKRQATDLQRAVEEKRQRTAEGVASRRAEAQRLADEKRKSGQELLAAVTARREARLKAAGDRKREAQEKVELRRKRRAETEMAVRAEYGGPMNLTVRSKDGSEFHVRFRNATRLKALMELVCSKWGLQRDLANFTHEGRQLWPNDTPLAVGLENHGVIQVDGPVESEEDNATEAAWEDVAQEQPTGKTLLIVRNPEGRELQVRMPALARLQVMMAFTCKRLGLKRREVRFMHNGTRLSGAGTLQQAGLADGAVVFVEPDPEYFEAIRRAGEEARRQLEEEEATFRAEEQAREEARRWAEEAEQQRASKEAAQEAQREARRRAAEERKQQRLNHTERMRAEAAERAARAAEDEVRKRSHFGEAINVVVREATGNTLAVKLRAKTPLKVLMGVACKRLELEQARATFLRNGRRLFANETVETSGLRDQDVIEVEMQPEDGGEVDASGPSLEVEMQPEDGGEAHLLAGDKAKLRHRELSASGPSLEAPRLQQPSAIVLEPPSEPGGSWVSWGEVVEE